MSAEPAAQLATSIQIFAAQNSQLLEHGVLSHCAVPFRQKKSVPGVAVRPAPHQPKVNDVNYFQTTERRRDMKSGEPLRYIEDPPAHRSAPCFRACYRKTVVGSLCNSLHMISLRRTRVCSPTCRRFAWRSRTGAREVLSVHLLDVR